MNRNNFWRFALVALVLIWSLYEIYPPRGRNLVEVFQERAITRDATFNAIVAKAQELSKAAPEKAYDNSKRQREPMT
jgi:hypothetical protein